MACSQSKLFDIFFLNGQIDRFDVEPAPSFVLCKRDIKEMIKRLQDMTDAECPLPVCGRPLSDKGKRNCGRPVSSAGASCAACRRPSAAPTLPASSPT